VIRTWEERALRNATRRYGDRMRMGPTPSPPLLMIRCLR
jgi:hypothetical protein